MSDEDEAQAVLAALANVWPCPLCHRPMDMYHNWDDPQPRYSCSWVDCKFCCMDSDGIACRPDGDVWPW